MDAENTKHFYIENDMIHDGSFENLAWRPLCQKMSLLIFWLEGLCPGPDAAASELSACREVFN